MSEIKYENWKSATNRIYREISRHTWFQVKNPVKDQVWSQSYLEMLDKVGSQVWLQVCGPIKSQIKENSK